MHRSCAWLHRYQRLFCFSFLIVLGLVIKPFIVNAGVLQFLYIADTHNNRIVVFNLTLRKPAPELEIKNLNAPFDVVSHNGYLYISEPTAGKIQIYQVETGAFGGAIDVGLCGCPGEPKGLAVASIDLGAGILPHLFVADGAGYVRVYDIATNAEVLNWAVNNPVDVTVMNTTQIFVTSGDDTVYGFDLATTPPTPLANFGVVNTPQGIVEKHGVLYIADHNNEVDKYALPANPQDVFVPHICLPNSLVFANNTAYITYEYGVIEYPVGCNGGPEALIQLDAPWGIEVVSFVDGDDDGLVGVSDLCPTEAGAPADKGCPLPPPSNNNCGSNPCSNPCNNPCSGNNGSSTTSIQIGIDIDIRLISNIDDNSINIRTTTSTTIETTIYRRQIEHTTAAGQASIGMQEVLSQEIIFAVDIFTNFPNTSIVAIAEEVQICVLGTGSFIYLEAQYAPRRVTYLAVAHVFQYTCTTITTFGTLILVKNENSPLVPPEPYIPTVERKCGCNPTSTPTSSNSIAIAISTEIVALNNCRVTIQYMLNFRTEPNSDSEIITQLAYELELTAIARARNIQSEIWYNVIYGDENGWVSAKFVTTIGQC